MPKDGGSVPLHHSDIAYNPGEQQRPQAGARISQFLPASSAVDLCPLPRDAHSQLSLNECHRWAEVRAKLRRRGYDHRSMQIQGAQLILK